MLELQQQHSNNNNNDNRKFPSKFEMAASSLSEFILAHELHVIFFAFCDHEWLYGLNPQTYQQLTSTEDEASVSQKIPLKWHGCTDFSHHQKC